MGNDTELKELPLHAMHARAGARFGPFAGWSMPLTYPDGVLKEHLHCREAAGLFDISHMRLLELSGPAAAPCLAHACPLDPDALELGHSRYTFFLNEDAGILDDLIVTRLGEERFLIVANAGNAEEDETHLRQIARDHDCKVEALPLVFLALQGPAAASVATDCGLDIDVLHFMQAHETKDGWIVARSGYTGEDGFEIALPADEAEKLADRLLADDRTRWIGLAARDSLRLEAGLCLHGQDITAATTPVEAALLWAIPRSLRRRDAPFIGAAALAARIDEPPRERRVGLKPEGRQPVRAGAVIRDGDGREVGRVTSGGFGPSVGGPVAMGYLARDAGGEDAPLFADVRGNAVPIARHPLPFHPHRHRKG